MAPSLEGFQETVAVVTGGASGIGRACARTLSKLGSTVAVLDRDMNLAEAVVGDIEQGGGSAFAIHVDVTNENEVTTALERSRLHAGRIDILINSAGATDFYLQSADRLLHEVDIDVWDGMMKVNARGVFLTCKHVIPEMRLRGRGSIVNVSSLMAHAGDERLSAYSASKAAVEALTRSVSIMYGRDGIRCNAVAPGVIITPERGSNPKLEISHLPRIPLQRFGDVADVARLVAFLSSRSADYVTGQVITIDGGLGAQHPWTSPQ